MLPIDVGRTIVATPGTSVISVTNVSMPPSAQCFVTVLNVTGTTSGLKTNNVTVASNEAGQGNTSTATLIVAAPPTIAKSFGAASDTDSRGRGPTVAALY